MAPTGKLGANLRQGVADLREILAHTADLKAEIAAGDLQGLYREGTHLVREILVGASPVAARESRIVPLAGADEGERLFRFLRELVFLADAERFLPASVELGEQSAQVAGEPFDPERHRVERQVKALTRHQFELEQQGRGYRCRMVFDL